MRNLRPPAPVQARMDDIDTQTPETAAEIGIVAPEQAAEEAGLHYVHATDPGIRRERDADGWRYIGPSGKPVTDEKTLARIAKLAIPPAYADVWICKDARGHLQAVGTDARGRRQYRYHADFRAIRDSNKFGHMLDFARALPKVRATIGQHMALRGMPREKVLATVVYLLETTLIRVGNDEYAKDNASFGLTTLESRHVAIAGSEMRFRFKGKSNKEWNLRLKDRRVAKLVKAAQELPGQHLFQYVGEDGTPHAVTSSDVNAYLRDIAGTPVTAKDFRTWAGTVLAATALAEFDAFETPTAAKKNVKAAIERVAAQLGNTPTICRKCYVHPEIVGAYMDKALALTIAARVEHAIEDAGELHPDEQAVLAFLKERIEAAPA